jgi:hypothetical protein
MQKARRHPLSGPEGPESRAPTDRRRYGFRFYFTPRQGCFSPFPHGTRSLSVSGECLALEGGPPNFPPGFSCPAVLRKRPEKEASPFAYRAFTFFDVSSQTLQLDGPLVTFRSWLAHRTKDIPVTPAAQRALA